jgi:hypothetical protein
MPVRSAATTHPVSDRKPSKGGAVDGRTLVARRRRELIEVYAAALGGADALSEGQLIDIRKAAELTALAEQARARAMRDGTADIGELSAMIRLESTAARAVRTLGIKPTPNQPQRPDVAAYRVQRAARRATETPASEVA